MKRERRRLTRRELASITSARPVLRRVPPPARGVNSHKLHSALGTAGPNEGAWPSDQGNAGSEGGRTMLDPMMVERAEGEIDRYIERRSSEKEKANERAAMWRESERKHHERRRRQNLALWYDFFLSMADSHAQLATSYEERALRLLEEGGGGSIANA